MQSFFSHPVTVPGFELLMTVSESRRRFEKLEGGGVNDVKGCRREAESFHNADFC